MYCDFCIKASISANKTTFVNGCKTLKVESIKHHEISNMHLFATNKHMNVEKPEDAPAVKAQLSLNKLAMDRLNMDIYYLCN